MPQQTHKRLKLQPLQLLEAAVSSTSTQIKVIIEPFEQGSVTDVDHIIFSQEIQASFFCFFQ